MATDRADEIAAEALRQAFAAMHEATGWMGDMDDANYASALPAIAAALRSYGEERVQEFRMRTMHGDHPALKASPSTQGTRTRIIILAYRGDIDVTPKPAP